MARLRLAVCQVNTVVGDLIGNADRITAALHEAESSAADLAIFPELTITGYPPEDLLGRPSFIGENVAIFERLASASGPCAAVIGYVATDPDGQLVNAAALCANGKVMARYGKRLLPNYGVFDEQRWFTPGDEPFGFTVVAGVSVAITICEDMWVPRGPIASQAEAGASLVVNLNASPYSRGRRQQRLAVLTERVAEADCAIAYVNQVGGQDELVFDGASVVLGADGAVLTAASQFVEEVLLVDVDLPASPRASKAPVVSLVSRAAALPTEPGRAVTLLERDAEIYQALVLGTRDYVTKNGFTDVVIGLSGGIDSSLVASVAVDALGAKHVHGVAMPSRYSSAGSVEHAVSLASNLGIDVSTVPIESSHRTLASALAPLVGGDPVGLTDENLQSRIRAVLLMALSNAKGWMVLTTGNKSEMATGYSTLYGDSAGGFAVIKDVEKTVVYQLCRFANLRAGFDLIPEPVLTKAPSAELRPDQRDDESLPPYDILDPILSGYVEQDCSAEDLIASGFDRGAVERVVQLVDQAEYKRRQMPPGVRISAKAFGKDRRMPITNGYRRGPTYG